MRVTVILSVFVILSSVILMNAILQSYDQRTVSVRTAEIQNQCTILSNQLVNSDYLKTGVSDVIDTELSQLSNIYNGRVLVIDDEFRIVEDTYDLEEGKTIISEDVVKCFRGEKPASYDRKSRYIEVAVPVKKGEEPVKGMILVSVSTDSLRDNVEALQTKARIATVAISIIGIFLSAIIGMLLVRPLKRMSQSIEEMAGGYGDNYLHENAYDETERISNAFNKLWDRYKVLDASREEFVANVSHELKTPIALIQGYAEGLKEGVNDDEESRNYYCEVIVDEASKMNQMVQKLLTLNQLEFGNKTVSLERFDVVDLIRNYLQSSLLLCEQKGVQLKMEDYPPIHVWADEFGVEEVFNNYFTNAMNHVDGEKIIEVQVQPTENKVRVSVFNTGAPIPEDSIAHIWEKFYKVDKARTRAYGGSGVGLSIVKAIMDSMNQSYGVLNYDNGVEFWFELDKGK